MKNEPASPSAWEKIAAARRRSLAGSAPADEQSPFGFAARMASCAMALRRQERLAWWTRWSMRAAFCAALVAGVTALRRPAEVSGSPLLLPPALEIPGLSTL